MDNIFINDILNMTPSQIHMLTPAQVIRIPPAVLRMLKSEQFMAFNTMAVKAFSPMQVAAFTPMQLNSLDSNADWHLCDLSPAAFVGFSPMQIRALEKNIDFDPNATNFLGLSKQQIACLTPMAVRALTPKELKVFSGEQLQAIGFGLSPNQIDFLIGTGQVVDLSPFYISILSPSAIQTLRPDQIGHLDANQVAALRNTQIQALNPEQFMAFNAVAVKGFTAKQVASFTPDKLSSLMSNSCWHLCNLSPDAFAGFNPEQIKAMVRLIDLGNIDTHGFLGLSLNQLQKLTSVAVAALTNEELSVFTHVQLDAVGSKLTKPQLQFLNEIGHTVHFINGSCLDVILNKNHDEFNASKELSDSQLARKIDKFNIITGNGMHHISLDNQTAMVTMTRSSVLSSANNENMTLVNDNGGRKNSLVMTIGSDISKELVVMRPNDMQFYSMDGTHQLLDYHYGDDLRSDIHACVKISPIPVPKGNIPAYGINMLAQAIEGLELSHAPMTSFNFHGVEQKGYKMSDIIHSPFYNNGMITPYSS